MILGRGFVKHFSRLIYLFIYVYISQNYKYGVSSFWLLAQRMSMDNYNKKIRMVLSSEWIIISYQSVI